MRDGPEELHRKLEDSACTTSATVTSLKRDWNDEQTQTILRRARFSEKTNRTGGGRFHYYTGLDEVFPALYSRIAGDDIRHKIMEQQPAERETETPLEEIVGIVDEFRTQHAEHIVELDTALNTIKVSRTRNLLKIKLTSPRCAYVKQPCFLNS